MLIKIQMSGKYRSHMSDKRRCQTSADVRQAQMSAESTFEKSEAKVFEEHPEKVEAFLDVFFRHSFEWRGAGLPTRRVWP